MMAVKNGLLLQSDLHYEHFIKSFSNFAQNQTLTDVTLVSDDKIRIEAHKIILCAGSGFFRDFFVKSVPLPREPLDVFKEESSLKNSLYPSNPIPHSLFPIHRLNPNMSS